MPGARYFSDAMIESATRDSIESENIFRAEVRSSARDNLEFEIEVRLTSNV